MPAREYASSDIAVSFEAERCIHSGMCLRGLPEVFDTARRPWILPQAASADAIAAVITRCPSGALRYRRLDGGPEETPDAEASAVAVRDGPLYVRGDIELREPEGNVVARVNRAALCRCGQSEHKPFCDNSHGRVGFRAL
jgi:uncharacterized Fe-S cluster protein YjdI/CDGSH-type Zn-finger protein